MSALPQQPSSVATTINLVGEAEWAIVGGETKLDAMLTRPVAECLAAAPNVPTQRIALILAGPEAARLQRAARTRHFASSASARHMTPTIEPRTSPPVV